MTHIRRNLQAISTMTFKYFAFGSNLLKERIHLNSPSAKYVCVAKLQDYKLTFSRNRVIKEWQEKQAQLAQARYRWGPGGVATILESPGDCVWGTLWEIGKHHLPALDKQEGVEMNCYRPLTLTVSSHNGNEMFECRTYQMVDVIEHPAPSPHYIGTVVEGATQSGLPEDYVQVLKSIKHNNFQGEAEIVNEIKKSMSNKDLATEK